MSANRELLVDAANFLVRSGQAEKILADIARIADGWACTPMVYDGPLAPLNTLVSLAVTDRTKFQRVVQAIRQTRQKTPKARTNLYQSELMSKIRSRERRAIELREHEVGDMEPVERDEYLVGLRQRWSQARSVHVDATREEFKRTGQTFTRDARYETIAAFWAKVDMVLDQRLGEARAKGPKKKR